VLNETEVYDAASHPLSVAVATQLNTLMVAHLAHLTTHLLVEPAHLS